MTFYKKIKIADPFLNDLNFYIETLKEGPKHNLIYFRAKLLNYLLAAQNSSTEKINQTFLKTYYTAPLIAGSLFKRWHQVLVHRKEKAMGESLLERVKVLKPHLSSLNISG